MYTRRESSDATMMVPDGGLLEKLRERLGFGAKDIYSAGPQVAPAFADWARDDVGQLQEAAACDGQRHGKARWPQTNKAEAGQMLIGLVPDAHD